MTDELAARRAPSNLTCVCGSEWWVTAVVVDAADRAVTGYSVTLACSSCGRAEGGTQLDLDDLPTPGHTIDRARAAGLREAIDQVQTEARWQATLDRRPLRPGQDIGERLRVLEQILTDRVTGLEASSA